MIKINKILVLSFLLVSAVQAQIKLPENATRFARSAVFETSRFAAGALACEALYRLRSMNINFFGGSNLPNRAVIPFATCATAGLAPQGLNRLATKLPVALSWLAKQDNQPATAGRLAFWLGIAVVPMGGFRGPNGFGFGFAKKTSSKGASSAAAYAPRYVALPLGR